MMNEPDVRHSLKWDTRDVLDKSLVLCGHKLEKKHLDEVLWQVLAIVDAYHKKEIKEVKQRAFDLGYEKGVKDGFKRSW